MKILIVVDMQNDFISGALGTPAAEAIVPKVMEKISQWEGDIFVTQDTHDKEYLSTQEGRLLPVIHCVEETYGWEIDHTVQAILSAKNAAFSNVTYLTKNTFGCRSLAQALSALHMDIPIEEIQLVGLCTDICVISNAMTIKTFLPDVPICVDAACCAGVTSESHANALSAMKACQIHIINE